MCAATDGPPPTVFRRMPDAVFFRRCTLISDSHTDRYRLLGCSGSSDYLCRPGHSHSYPPIDSIGRGAPDQRVTRRDGRRFLRWYECPTSSCGPRGGHRAVYGPSAKSFGPGTLRRVAGAADRPVHRRPLVPDSVSNGGGCQAPNWAWTFRRVGRPNRLAPVALEPLRACRRGPRRGQTGEDSTEPCCPPVLRRFPFGRHDHCAYSTDGASSDVLAVGDKPA